MDLQIPLQGILPLLSSQKLVLLSWLLQKRFLQGVSGPQVMLYQGTLTALLFAPFLSVSPGALTLGTWGLLLLLGTVFTAVPHTLITHALRRVSATGVSFVLALLLVTFLHLVVGEMAPKSWAIAHPERTATALAIPMRGFMWLVRPGIAHHAKTMCQAARGDPAPMCCLHHFRASLRALPNSTADA